VTSIETMAKRYRNRAHAGAFIRGAKARHWGCARDACPYKDTRCVLSKRSTWSASFRSAWLAGYDAQVRTERVVGA
jgi:ribosome modulation factor